MQANQAGMRHNPKEARCPMPRLIAIAAPLKAALIAASFALARGDMLSVILISAVFNLVDLGAKPSTGKTERERMVVSRSHDR
jgi:hypothetical protein